MRNLLPVLMAVMMFVVSVDANARGLKSVGRMAFNRSAWIGYVSVQMLKGFNQPTVPRNPRPLSGCVLRLPRVTPLKVQKCKFDSVVVPKLTIPHDSVAVPDFPLHGHEPCR